MGQKLTGFLTEADKNRAGFKHADRLAAWASRIDDRGDATVWVETGSAENIAVVDTFLSFVRHADDSSRKGRRGP